MLKSNEKENNTKSRETLFIKVTASKCTGLSHVKNIFIKWSQSVTYHCYPKIFKEKTHFAARLIWILVFFSFTGLTSYILLRNVLAYFEYNVVSTVEVINESPTFFPTVTICDSNPFSTFQAETLIRQLIADDQSALNLSNMSYIDVLAYYEYVAYITKQFVYVPEYGDANRRILGFNLSDLVQTCRFNNIPCNLSNDFHWLFHFDYGNCFQFNSGFNMNNEPVNLKEAIYEGQMYGFSLKLGPVTNENSFATTDSRGLKVYVHNQSFVPLDYDTALSVEAGKQTNIAVTRTFASNVPQPYSNCVDLSQGFSSEFYNLIVAGFSNVNNQGN